MGKEKYNFSVYTDIIRHGVLSVLTKKILNTN